MWGQAVIIGPSIQTAPYSNNYLYFNKMHWAGNWASNLPYSSQDVVTLGGVVAYVSLAPLNIGNPPATSPTWWTPLPGTPGPIGPPGPASGGAVLTTPYNFTPQTITSPALTGGVAATVTLAPCPLGLNPASDLLHWLYVSGTGTPEAVLSTGGSCTPGATSGTVSFTPTGSHAGGYTVGSATSGGQEAANANPNGAIQFPTGTSASYAPITLNPPSTAGTITCPSWGSILSAQTPAADIIDAFSSNPTSVSGCTLSAAVTRTGGSAIQLGNGTTDNSAGSRFQKNQIQGQYNGFYVASGNDWTFSNNSVAASNYDMLIRNLVNGDQGDFSISDNQFLQFAVGGVRPPAVIRWESGGGMKFQGNKIVSGSFYGLDCVCSQLVCTGDINIVDNSIEGFVTAGIRLSTTNGPVGRGVISGNQIAGAGVGLTMSGLSSGSITEFSVTGNDFAVGGITIGPFVDFLTIQSNVFNGAQAGASYVIDPTTATANFLLVANNVMFGNSVPAYGPNANMVVFSPGAFVEFGALPTAARFGSSIAVDSIDTTTSSGAVCATGVGGGVARRVRANSGTVEWHCN